MPHPHAPRRSRRPRHPRPRARRRLRRGRRHRRRARDRDRPRRRLRRLRRPPPRPAHDRRGAARMPAPAGPGTSASRPSRRPRSAPPAGAGSSPRSPAPVRLAAPLGSGLAALGIVGILLAGPGLPLGGATSGRRRPNLPVPRRPGPPQRPAPCMAAATAARTGGTRPRPAPAARRCLVPPPEAGAADKKPASPGPRRAGWPPPDPRSAIGTARADGASEPAERHWR